MKNRNNKNMMMTILKTVAVPLLIWVVMEIVSRSVAGVGVIDNSADVKTLFRNLITTLAFALALSTNLTSGRMDLSIGAQMYAGVIFGGNLALRLGWNGFGILACSMAVGALCGLLIGFLFIKLRILPMVLGLGMTLVFECSCCAVNDQQGVIFTGKPGTEMLSNITFIVAVCALLIIITTYLFQYSEYGYRYHAVQGNQKLAHDAGINIYSNCLKCYIIAGVLVACAGVFSTAYSGSLTPVLGMTSNGQVFSSMFPMVLGMWIGGFCDNNQVGVLFSSLSVNLIVIGLSKLGIGTSTQNIIIYVLFLLFVIYNTNKGKIKYNHDKKERIALAEKMLSERAAVN